MKMKKRFFKIIALLLTVCIGLGGYLFNYNDSVLANYTKNNILSGSSEYATFIYDDDSYAYLDTRDRYNGEYILASSNKASMLTEIMKNGQNLTVLEIVPFKLASTYQVNANPDATTAYFDYYFEEHPEATQYFSQSGNIRYNSSVTVNIYNSKEDRDSGVDPIKTITDYGSFDPSKYSNKFCEVHYDFASYNRFTVNAGTITHGFDLYFSCDTAGNLTYLESKAGNNFLDSLIGELDSSNEYYKFRKYFETHVNVITVTASKLSASDANLSKYLYCEDPVDIVYIGGNVVTDSQILRNLMIFDKEEFDFCAAFLANNIRTYLKDFDTDVYASNSTDSEYTCDELLPTGGTAPWYDTYSKVNGKLVNNDLSWNMVKKLIAYIYGDVSQVESKYSMYAYDANSYINIVKADGTQYKVYQNIPVIMDEGMSESHKDYNVYKLQFLLQKMSSEVGTMSWPDSSGASGAFTGGAYPVATYQNTSYNENVSGSHLYNYYASPVSFLDSKTSYFPDDCSVKPAIAEMWPVFYTDSEELYMVATDDASSDACLFTLYDGNTVNTLTGTQCNAYTGFISYYLTEGSSYVTSAGIPTAADKLTGEVEWYKSGRTVYEGIDTNGDMSITNTTIRFRGSSNLVSYYMVTIGQSGSFNANYNTYGARGSTYYQRDIETDDSGIATITHIFHYLIGLDDSDFLIAPDASFTETEDTSYSVESVSAKNAFIAYYDSTVKSAGGSGITDITLDADNNLVVTYRIEDLNDKATAAVLYYSSTSDTNMSLNVEYGLQEKGSSYPDSMDTALITYSMGYSTDSEGKKNLDLQSIDIEYAKKLASDTITVTNEDGSTEDRKVEILTDLTGSMTVAKAKANKIYTAPGSDSSGAVYDFTAKIPQYLSGTTTINPLYQGLLDGSIELQFTAMSHLYLSRTSTRGNKTTNINLTDTALLRFVSRTLFDLD